MMYGEVTCSPLLGVKGVIYFAHWIIILNSALFYNGLIEETV